VLLAGVSLAAALALAATGAAQALPGRNTVDSGDIINGEVKRPDLARGAVNSGKVANGSLRSIDVRNGTLRLADLGQDSVDGSKVLDGSLTGTDIGNSSLTGADIADGSLTGADIGNSSLTGADIANGSLTGADIGNSSLTGADIANGSLTGADVLESTLNFNDGTCQTELIKGFAQVNADHPDFPSAFTTSTTFLTRRHNCAGGTIQTKRFFNTDVGTTVLVRFNGVNATNALVGALTPSDIHAVVHRQINGTGNHGAFEIVLHRSGATASNTLEDFVILVF